MDLARPEVGVVVEYEGEQHVEACRARGTTSGSGVSSPPAGR
ncbi:hypothetical protein ACU610_19725 [Geodermatophilus sp. URMC 61]